MSAPVEERHRRAAWLALFVSVTPSAERWITSGIGRAGVQLRAAEVSQALADIEAAGERRGRIAGMQEAIEIAEDESYQGTDRFRQCSDVAAMTWRMQEAIDALEKEET